VVLGDFFHFVQANMKKIGELGSKSLANEVVVSVNKLWYAKTKADFDKELTEFFAEWEEKVPTYTSYFHKNWLDHYHPKKWASFA
jgi:hypothetical protein